MLMLLSTADNISKMVFLGRNNGAETWIPAKYMTGDICYFASQKLAVCDECRAT